MHWDGEGRCGGIFDVGGFSGGSDGSGSFGLVVLLTVVGGSEVLCFGCVVGSGGEECALLAHLTLLNDAFKSMVMFVE